MSQHATSNSPPAASNEPLYHLGYVSTEATPFSQIELVELLAVARNANESETSTGLLLYREAAFIRSLRKRVLCQENVQRN